MRFPHNSEKKSLFHISQNKLKTNVQEDTYFFGSTKSNTSSTVLISLSSNAVVPLFLINRKLLLTLLMPDLHKSQP